MSESRTYTVLGVVGTGGFGKVYRARLSGAGGFSKDVAIKVLHERNPDPDLLSRFRDEARILGLLRDRAIVSVDPPTRLSGRWAVVMDFVDGQSAGALLASHGRFPPGVALEVVGEIARALDKAYGFQGPEGQPLQLLHRDIKPANIQITPNGEVRLLDFGVARANFDGRESHTTRSISGTPGFIAPERLSGVEGPAGDVFSLGVVLWCLLTGERPSDRRVDECGPTVADEIAGRDMHLRAALQLASRMRDPDDRKRPTHRTVERECRSLRQNMPEPWLRDWAERIPQKQVESDGLAGQQLSETLFEARVEPADIGPDTTGSVSRTVLLGTGLMGFSAIGIASVVALTALLGVGGAVWLSQRRPAALPTPPTQVLVVRPPAPTPAPVAAPAPGPPEPPEPTPAPDPMPAPPPRPAPSALPPAPAPIPLPAAPEPARAVEELPVSFRSVPWGADVSVDGEKVGSTPLIGFKLEEGSHRIELESGEARIVKTIHVGRRSPTDYKWTVKDGSAGWEAGFGAR